MIVNPDTGTLRLENISREDEGNYSCIAKTRAGIVETTAYLTVNIKPSIELIENLTVLEGVHEVTLSCKVIGNPLPSIQWKRAGYKYVDNPESIQK